MLRFLIVSEKPDKLNDLKKGFIRHGVRVDVKGSVHGVMEAMAGNGADLVIFDENVDGVDGKKLIEHLIKKNPMVNTALVSSMNDEDFHEYTEGLGILMKIPECPSEDVADDVLVRLQKLLSLYI